MNDRRMFSGRIGNTARFLQMPLEAHALYFHLVLRADDDGVVEAYPVTQLLGTGPDVMKILLAKEFVHQLNKDQVVLINNWLEHNKIRADRKIDSIYCDLLPPGTKTVKAKPRSDVTDNSKRVVDGQWTVHGQQRLGKDSIGKDRLGEVYTASDDAVEKDGVDYLLTKKKKKLVGKRLQAFNIFWDKFNYKKGKREAADAWLDIPEITNTLLRKIYESAEKEAKQRPTMISEGRTPKMAQGWISGKRWEDELETKDKSKYDEMQQQTINT